MEKAKLVLIPVPGTGHLISTVEFAKRLLDLSDNFSITILIIRPPRSASEMEKYNKSFSTLDTRIQYITLPQVNPPDSIDPVENPEYFWQVFLDSHKTHVKSAILNEVISNDDSVPLAGLVVDMFCASMIDVAKEIQVPSYVFYTSGAGFLGLVMYLQTHHDQVGSGFEETGPDHDILSYVNPVPSSVLPTFVFNDGYKTFVYQARKFKEANGVIVNSFLELESHAVKTFQDCDDVPPVYTVGPLINLRGQSHQGNSNENKRGKILEWLDDQPEKSVVFLCFGSMGSFTEPQLEQIAIALERTGHRFLWSVRKKQPKENLGLPTEYDNYDEFLPEGFLERTRKTGLVCGWVPQVEVLGHKAIGAFVSHCGWNSILESVWHGVPIVAWPMYAEQQINAFQIVKDLGLAIAIRLDYRTNHSKPCPVVMADEIIKPLECVMKSDCEVRDKVKAMSQRSRQALKEGGPSFAQLRRLIDVMLQSKV